MSLPGCAAIPAPYRERGQIAYETGIRIVGMVWEDLKIRDLLTADALQAKPGRRVLIERWGGDAALEGRVRLVEPAGFTKVSALGVEEQRVKVLIDIVSPAEQWRDLGDAPALRRVAVEPPRPASGDRRVRRRGQ